MKRLFLVTALLLAGGAAAARVAAPATNSGSIRGSSGCLAAVPGRSFAERRGWCRRVDSNNRPSPYEDAALPLSYARILVLRAIGTGAGI